MVNQHQYNGMAQDEQLEDVLDQHEEGLANELSEYNREAVLDKAHLVSLVTKGTTGTVINKEYSNITVPALLADFRAELNAIWEPEYETDVMVGAGTTVKITD